MTWPVQPGRGVGPRRGADLAGWRRIRPWRQCQPGLEDRATKGAPRSAAGRQRQERSGLLTATFATSAMSRSGHASSTASRPGMGSDHTNPYHTEHVGAGFGFQLNQTRWSFDVTRERQRTLMVQGRLRMAASTRSSELRRSGLARHSARGPPHEPGAGFGRRRVAAPSCG